MKFNNGPKLRSPSSGSQWWHSLKTFICHYQNFYRGCHKLTKSAFKLTFAQRSRSSYAYAGQMLGKSFFYGGFPKSRSRLSLKVSQWWLWWIFSLQTSFIRKYIHNLVNFSFFNRCLIDHNIKYQVSVIYKVPEHLII